MSLRKGAKNVNVFVPHFSIYPQKSHQTEHLNQWTSVNLCFYPFQCWHNQLRVGIVIVEGLVAMNEPKSMSLHPPLALLLCNALSTSSRGLCQVPETAPFLKETNQPLGPKLTIGPLWKVHCFILTGINICSRLQSCFSACSAFRSTLSDDLRVTCQ